MYLFPIDKILYLQGNLKELSVENYERLKKSILDNGIISPGYVWKHGRKIYALDCHQRLKTLKAMKKEGFPVPHKIPVVEILARDERQAKRYLLQYASQHGTVTADGLYEFIHDAGFDMDLDELNNELSIGGIDFVEFREAYFDEQQEKEDGEEMIDDIDSGGNAEKFSFVISNAKADIAHKALKKAESEIDSGDGSEQFVELCKKYLKGG